MEKKTEKLISHWREVGPVVWAEGAYGWIDIDGRPIRLEPWQEAVLSAWWAHRESTTTLLVSNIKKTGKTLLNANLLAWRWLALPGEHFAVGNDLDQSAGRQFKQISEMVRRNEYLKRNTRVTNKLLTFEPTGSTMAALSVDAASNAGANHLTASHTEAWGIIYEAGIRAYEELTPPPGSLHGFPALRICDSYAGFDGESDTWHNLVDRGLAGERISDKWPITKNGGLLLFHMEGEEAQKRCFRGTPLEADVYYADQQLSLRGGSFLRLHKNIRATGSEQFIPLEEWDACVDPDHRPILPDPNVTLFVGVDGSIKHDSSSVVAVTNDHEAGRVVLVRHRIWQPTAKDPLDLDATIGDFLRTLYRGYSIRAINYDPFQLHDLATRLRSEGLPMEEYPQSVPNLTKMGTNLFELIKSKNLQTYDAPDLRLQVSHAIAVESSRGWKIAKEKTSHKIDGVVALAMAALAAIESKEAFWYMS